MERLKDCPFCGGFGGVRQNIYATHYYIICCSCGCTTKYFGYQEDAVEAWNRRAEPNRGKWIPNSPFTGNCSECGGKGNLKDNYCSTCGAKMDGMEQKGEIK